VDLKVGGNIETMSLEMQRCVILLSPQWWRGWLNELGRWIKKPITNTAWVRSQLCKLTKGCTRLTAESDNVYQFLALGWWFSPGTQDSSTTKTGRHDIVEILLKVALKKQTINQLINIMWLCNILY
jgi:hypothetical protein